MPHEPPTTNDDREVVPSRTKELAAPEPRLLLANLRGELDGAALYAYLSSLEPDPNRSSILAEMSDTEAKHARIMARSLQRLGIAIPPHRESFRNKLLKFVARLAGPQVVYPVLQGLELSGTKEYQEEGSVTEPLAADERSHARVLSEITIGARGAERWHRSGGGGALRATVFGVSDGILSNLGMVMGFSGAQADSKFVVLAGLAGLFAGASSMAAGEYVSMRAQRELLERQIDLESAELMVTPAEELEELVQIYRAKGLPAADAKRIAEQLLSRPDIALDTLVREELGLDPKELGSPWGAAISSFLAFAIGAALPVIPFFTGAGFIQIAGSLVIASIALFGIGAILTMFTGRNPLLSGLRQLFIGAAATAVTFGLGKVIGVSTGI